MAQTNFALSPAAGAAGTLDQSYSGQTLEISYANDVATRPGTLLVRRDQTTDDIPVAGPPLADTAAADSIHLTGVSAAAPQVITLFDGVEIGNAYLGVPDTLSVTFNSDTDWDASNMTLTGIGSDGQVVTDTIAIPEDGNATVNSTVVFWRLTQIDIPAQTGAGGTYTVGNTGAGRTLTAAQILGVAREDRSVVDGPTFPAPVPSAQGGQRDTHDALRSGQLWVETEEALTVAGPVFVRVVATGAEELGQFRLTADGTDTVLLAAADARAVRSASATLASLAVNFTP